MKPRIFLSAPFLIALFVLLLNDHVLKAAYGNTLTGKLSDFAGILLVSLWVFDWKPRHIHVTAWLIALAFTIWKSALVTPLIALFNQWSPYTIGRVIDVTDLWALSMIPVAIYLTRNASRALLPEMFKVPVIIMSMLAIMATSRAKQPLHIIDFQYLDSKKAHVVPELDGDIKSAFKDYGLSTEPPYSNDYFSVDYRIDASGNVSFEILEAESGGIICLFCADKNLEVLKFRHHLERRLNSSAYKDMFFVIKNKQY
jgi:hypothetical protein